MAEMVPDKLPSRASAGEKRLFSVLQKLPDDCIVYYEPIVEDRYPDFIVILPDLGLLVIEVKGWYPKDILGADSGSVLLKEQRGEVRRNHPVRQARDYMLSLMDECQNHSYGKRLLQKDGEHKGRFVFPFGHFAIMSNMTRSQVQQHQLGNLDGAFPPNKVVTRDVVESWTDDEFTGKQLYQVFKNFFDPFWSFPKLGENQTNAIRAIIHREIVLPTPNNEVSASGQVSEPLDIGLDLKVLDLRQENNARNLGDGHRIIYGVAGSGKTVLLIAKARLLSAQNPEAKILLLCYNVALATYLNKAVSEFPGVTVKHFDGWAKANGSARRQKESNDQLGERFLKTLEDGTNDTCRYDCVLIDECQDFAVSWYKCVLEAMQDPNDGDLVIVGDGSQGLYGRAKVRWKDIGIKAQGRTISNKFDLDKNYRNAREIIELASIFATKPQTEDKEENSIVSMFVDPTKCQRYAGVKPVLVKSLSRREETSRVLTIVKNLLDGTWFGNKIEPLKPEQIAIFYPLAYKNEQPILQQLIQGLTDLAPVVWLNDPNDYSARTRVVEPGIKVQTIHSAKGLQYRAVIFMWADHLPRQFDDTNVEEERCLMYVALTRPENYLAISSSGYSDFISEIQESGKVVMV
ncbi:DNA helicase [Dulcicalothrix desertica PCC 7102]|uniref:DNA helicase n=1 Tax=Dulcicalothrix desertica PCC 7102 TaxID=232991 RepID=A0A433UIZ7_9CYAN|nr:nuclease-related domain-containing DEAD/DEAH box helicase [Dulcicalothrix desertica]RUS93797.1 DNA helicase [Dulcicalothrix desertica PCC 7102]TWH62724.1 superfamily I DNA and RNA helicase [Dulcicalothrix desertica PCC 7102]